MLRSRHWQKQKHKIAASTQLSGPPKLINSINFIYYSCRFFYKKFQHKSIPPTQEAFVRKGGAPIYKAFISCTVKSVAFTISSIDNPMVSKFRAVSSLPLCHPSLNRLSEIVAMSLLSFIRDS